MATINPPTKIEPYLFFNGRCDDAIAFYRTALGAEVQMLMRFKENPDPNMPSPPGTAEKVMHANVRIGNASVMMSDGRCEGKPNFDGFALSLEARDAAHAGQLFAALSAGGQVQVPLSKTFFSPSFGMVTDCFGVLWMVLVPSR